MNWIIVGLFFACGQKEADTSSTADQNAEPESTAEPENTTEPESTPEPENTPEPEATPEPENTPEPEATPEPETTPEPENTPEPDSGSTEQGDAAAGELVVQSTCMGYCHSSNPAIANSGSMTEEELRTLFANGQGYMPAQNLSEQETLDVIAYLWETYGE